MPVPDSQPGPDTRWYDRFFPAAAALRQAAAQGGTPAPVAVPSQGNAGIDMASEAQKAADRMNAAKTPPAAVPAGPLTKAAQKKGTK